MNYKIINKEALLYLHKRVSEIHKELTKDILSFSRMNKMLDSYDVCLLLGISARTLQYYRDTDKLPFSLFHGKCLYHQEDIEKFIEERKMEARNPKKK